MEFFVRNSFWCVVCYAVMASVSALTQNETISMASNSLADEPNAMRRGRWFPFYTIGRFQNTPCVGTNRLVGTCTLNGECKASGGIATGSCNSLTRQAVCCVYQQTCNAVTSENNTYFVNPNYPNLWDGSTQSCSLTINPSDTNVCQLRIEFLDLSLAQPNGDGFCVTDVLSISGGASKVPSVCGENSGQHIVVDFFGADPITLTIRASSAFTFGRHWHIHIAQVNCNSDLRAPSGCLQYHLDSSGVIRSFNYDASSNSQLNLVGVEGTRQLAKLRYGICIRSKSTCSITYSTIASDSFSFTMSGDVGAVDGTLLGTGILQQQMCTTDFLIIPNPSQSENSLIPGFDRFCGLGLSPTTSNVKPFIVYVVTDSDEAMDIGNRGFALTYTQNVCPLFST